MVEGNNSFITKDFTENRSSYQLQEYSVLGFKLTEKFDNQPKRDAALSDSETFIRTKPEEKSLRFFEIKRVKEFGVEEKNQEK
jgi:hypothetical protein